MLQSTLVSVAEYHVFNEIAVERSWRLFARGTAVRKTETDARCYS